MVLGEFDDTKDDGWEQTFDVGLLFNHYFFMSDQFSFYSNHEFLMSG